MATGTSFKQQCPSCEAMVPIRDPGLIGRKIDCPKCKYRFVVEEPPVEDDDEAPKKGAKAAPKRRGEEDADSKPKKKQQQGGGGSSILLIGGGLAAVAVVAIGVGVWALMGGDSKPNPSPSTSPSGPVASEQTTAEAPKKEEAPQVATLFNVSNLLPNDTQAVVAYPFSISYGSALKAAGVDDAEGGFKGERFRAQLGFGPEDINRLINATNPRDNWIFTVLQTKKPFNKDVVKAQLRLTPAAAVKGKSGKSHELFQVNADFESMGNLLLKLNQTKEQFQAYFYDSNTIVFADPAPMKKFLEDDAKPAYLTQDAPAGGGAPGAGTPGGPAAGSGEGGAMLPGKGGPQSMGGPPGAGGMGPGPMPGGPGMGMGPMPGGPGMGMGGPGMGQPADAASTPNSWLTVDPNLKRLLDRVEKLEENRATRKREPSSVITVAELKGPAAGPLTSALEQYAKDEKSFVPDQINKAAIGLVRRAKAVAASLWAFDQKAAHVTVALEYRDVREAEREDRLLRPLMELLPPAIKAGLGLTVHLNEPQGNTGGFAGGPGMGGPGAMMGMMMQMQGRGQPGFRGRRGGGGEEAGMGAPPVAGGGGLSTEGGPGGFGAPGGAQEEKNDGGITLSHEGQSLVFTMDLQLTSEAYDTLIVPAREAMQYLKSQAELSAGSNRVHELARALKAYFDDKKAFPKGALDRSRSVERGLPWRPDQRLSWAVELLPYFGDDFKEWRIDLQKGWNEDKNLLVAGRVVPQLVSPRTPGIGPVTTTYPGFPDKTFAVTHFVGVAGLGMDAAEYKSGDPATEKKLGVFGYDRVTKKEDVKDGLNKTIALLMVPGDHKSLWMAGGGATVRAISEDAEDGNPLAPFVCTYYPGKADEKSKWVGKRGTIAIMCDGKVRFIPEDIPAETFRALCTIAGGESIDRLDSLCPVIEEPEKREIKTEAPAAPAAPGAAPAAPPPAPAGKAAVPAGWKEFTSAAGRYTVALPPGKPMEKTQQQMGFSVRSDGVESPDGVGAFVSYGDLPVPTAPTGALLEKAYDNGRDEIARRLPGGKVTSEVKGTFEGNPGREITIAFTGGTMRTRFFFAGTRMYELSFVFQAGKSDEASVKAFFDSFRLTK